MMTSEHDMSPSSVERAAEAEGPVAVLRPVAGPERVMALDVTRGFALLGILLVNMAVFSSPMYYFLADVELWPDPLNQAVKTFIRFAAESKFYSMFSFLFGLGFCIQMDRAAHKGGDFKRVYGRRLLVLLVMGLAHALFIWNGDILTFYAVLGAVLLLFRNRAPRTLLIWVIVFLLLPMLFNGLMTLGVEIGRSIPDARAEIEAEFAKSIEDFKARGDRALQVYGSGSFGEIMTYRRQELVSFYAFLLIFLVPNVLAMFLLGLYVGRRGIYRDVAGHIGLIRKVGGWGLILGVIGNAAYTVALADANPAVPSVRTFVAAVGIMFGAPTLCLAYVCGLTLLVQRAKWQQRLAPLAAVGRMALSNYILQSVVCTLIFYNYGLGLFGRCPPAWGLVLTLVIYALQIPLSVWWLGRYRFGPLEWLWRSLTYVRSQRMRRVRQEQLG